MHGCAVHAHKILKVLYRPLCWCAGGPLGSGKQWVSWIHRDDLVDLIIDSIRNSSYAGVYNGTAPKPVTMAQLCSAVGGVMGRPSWLPVPDFAITTLLGEGAQVCC